jgi:hypothetical protein
MKLTLALLFVAFAASAQSQVGIPSGTNPVLPKDAVRHVASPKVDSVYFTPKPDQLKTLQQFDTQIEQLRKQQMELILLLIGEPVDPKTLQFDGKKFKAVKQK